MTKTQASSGAPKSGSDTGDPQLDPAHTCDKQVTKPHHATAMDQKEGPKKRRAAGPYGHKLPPRTKGRKMKGHDPLRPQRATETNLKVESRRATEAGQGDTVPDRTGRNRTNREKR